MCVLLPMVLISMTLTASNLLLPRKIVTGSVITTPARLAIYYGYPSLVNGSNGDLEKAAKIFAGYDVVILGDGIEFPDRQSARYPVGDAEEHEKARKIIAAAQRRNPRTRFFGYICLGEIISKAGETSLTPEQLEERARLWKQMGVAGIFLDEAGYDYAIVTRKRQNVAVRIIHELGLSAFMNAYFLDHLFSLEDNLPYARGMGKNPEHLHPLLDRRDLFLLESFQVHNGMYESLSAWRARLNQAREYRRRYGLRIFATTTTTEQEPLSTEKFTYAWWTAVLYGLDGFSWGEPNFAALSNALPDRGCTLDSTMLHALQDSSPLGSDDTRFWRKAGNFLIVGDATNHSVHRFPFGVSVESKEVKSLSNSPQVGELLSCGGSHES